MDKIEASRKFREIISRFQKADEIVKVIDELDSANLRLATIELVNNMFTIMDSVACVETWTYEYLKELQNRR